MYTCPQGLVFSPDKGSCTWIEEANRPGCQSEDKFTFVCPEVGPGQHPRYPDPNGEILMLLYLILVEILWSVDTISQALSQPTPGVFNFFAVHHHFLV